MSAQVEAAPPEIVRIVGSERVRLCSAADTIDGVQPRFVVEPNDAAEVARVLAVAAKSGLSVIPRGGGTKLDWGNAPRAADLVLSTARMNKIVEHAWGDMTAIVEAGCTIAELQRTLAEHDQRLALDSLWSDAATIGGVLATNDGGALRLKFGGLRDQLIGITVALSDGTLARSGGKVVKNVAGYDLPKLFTGAFGTLGVICAATFRLYPLPEERSTISFRAFTAEAMNRLALAILDSSLAPSGVQVRTDGSTQESHIDVLFEGATKTNEAQMSKLKERSASSGVEEVDRSSTVWEARAELWRGDEQERTSELSLVGKFSILPAELGWWCECVREVSARLGVGWKLTAQAFGVGWLRLTCASVERLIRATKDLRDAVEKRGGAFVVLRCAPDVKRQIDVWGETGDALELMRRIKKQFDPTNTLNPGRFVGGI